jgi:sugar phosphate isomerase/epimerase
MGSCPFGINGGEFPDWPVERIVELAVKVGAQFVELPAGRLGAPDAAQAREAAASAGLAIHVNGLVSALSAAFASARAVQAPYVVVADDAIERADASRAESFEAFRAAVLALLEAPAHRTMRLALENSIIKVTRQPEDLGELVTYTGHPRFGVNFDADSFYNAGVEPFPYAYDLLKDHILHLHAKDSASIAQVGTSSAYRWGPAP